MSSRSFSHALWLTTPSDALWGLSPLDAAANKNLRPGLDAALEGLAHAARGQSWQRTLDIPSLRARLGFEGAYDFVIEATVADIKPVIRRRFVMPGRSRFDQLHTVLQILFGWDDAHLHDFVVEGVTLELPSDDPYDLHAPYDSDTLELDAVSRIFGLSGVVRRPPVDESAFRLQQLVAAKTRFRYRYDFGDGWEVGLVVCEAMPVDATRRPRCLEGKRAGPPEDCGGVPGYDRMSKALTNLRDPERDEILAWLGGRTDFEHFDVDAANRALRRRFPDAKAQRAGASEPQAPVPYDPASGPPRLEHYRQHLLTLRDKMIVLLRDGPLTIDELAERLQAAGTPLALGVESVRRAWKRQLPIRERLDGRLEVVPDDSFGNEPTHTLSLASPRSAAIVQAAMAARALPPRGPIDVQTPLRSDELTVLETHGRSTLSLRKIVLMWLDAAGRPCTRAEIVAGLEALNQIRGDSLTHTSLTSPALARDGERYLLDVTRPEVAEVRQWVRERLADAAAREAHAQASTARWEANSAARKTRDDEHRRAFEQSRRVFVVLHVIDDAWVAAALDVGSMRVSVYETRTALVEALRAADWVFGFDPRGVFERIALDIENQRFVDLTPGFRSVEDAWGRRRSVTLSEIVAMSAPSEVPLTTPDECATLPREVLHDRLANDLRLMHRFWRHGVEQRFIVKGVTNHWVGDWDVGRERRR